MRKLAIIAGLVLATAVASAQAAAPRLEYDAASVKRSVEGGRTHFGAVGGAGTPEPTRVDFANSSMLLLLARAYGVDYFQIIGPSWIDGERYDVQANVPPGVTKEQAQTMMQNLLADRFQLKVHLETRDLPTFELVVANGGPKLTPYREDAARDAHGPARHGEVAVGVGNGRMHLVSRGTTIAQLTRILSDNLRGPVVDKTGIAGEYDFDFEYSPEGLGAYVNAPPSPASADDTPSLAAALQDRLGLKLESRKAPMPVVVIDHLEKSPTGN